MDIDVCVVISPTNLQHLINAAKELHLTPMLPVPLETLIDIETLKQWHIHRNLQAFSLRSEGMAGVTLDVLLFPPVDPAAMCQRALQLDVSGVRVSLASINDLNAFKRHEHCRHRTHSIPARQPHLFCERRAPSCIRPTKPRTKTAMGGAMLAIRAHGPGGQGAVAPDTIGHPVVPQPQPGCGEKGSGFPTAAAEV